MNPSPDSNMSFLIAAYACFWLATTVYLFTIDRRQKKALTTLRDLETKN